jgi:hypothetical protein
MQRGNRVYAQALIDEFMELLRDNEISKINNPSPTTLNAHRALKALGDQRVSLLRQRYAAFHEKVLGRLHDETLRTAYLSKFSVQTLLAALSD